MKKALRIIFAVSMLGVSITAISAMCGFQHYEITVKILLITALTSSAVHMLLSSD